MQTKDGTVWIGTGYSGSTGGLARFEFENGYWTVYTQADSDLPGNQILSLLQATDGAVWIGTADGLARFDITNDNWSLYDTSTSGLPNNAISALLQAADGAV